MMSRHQYEEVMRYIDKFYPKYSDPLDIKEKIDEKRIELGEANKKKYFNKLFDGIKKAAQGYHVKDFTDEEFPGLTFIVLLHKGQDILDDDRELIKALGGTRFDLEIYISMIAPYYCLFVNRTDCQIDDGLETWNFSLDNSCSDLKVVERIRNYLTKKGLKEIELSNSLILAEDRETFYTELGKTTIYDCLFDNIGAKFCIRGRREWKETSEGTIVTEPDIDWDSLRYDPGKAEE